MCIALSPDNAEVPNSHACTPHPGEGAGSSRNENQIFVVENYKMIISRNLLASSLILLAALAGTAQTAQANLLTNGSFESAVPGLSAGGYCYLGSTCSGAMPGWTGNVPTMASNSGAWGTPSNLGNWNASFGGQQIGLQGSASALGQAVTLGTASRMTLSWFDAGRSNHSFGNQQYTVSFAGVDLATFTTGTDQAWANHNLSFDAIGSGELKFRSLNVGNYDRTSFIDDVRLTAVANPVPEPQSLAMVLLGLAVVGAVSRRRSVRGSAR